VTRGSVDRIRASRSDRTGKEELKIVPPAATISLTTLVFRTREWPRATGTDRGSRPPPPRSRQATGYRRTASAPSPAVPTTERPPRRGRRPLAHALMTKARTIQPEIPRRQARPGGLGLRSRQAGRALSAMPHADGRSLPAGPAGDHAAGAGPVHVRGRPRDRQVGDTRVDGSHRWDVLWVHYEAEELRVTIGRPSRPTRHGP